MRKLEDIKAEIQALPTKDMWGTKKEVKELSNILNDDEHIKALCSGILDGNTWLIVCTEKRVLFLDKGMLYGLKQRETPIEKINSIEQKKGLLLGGVAIWDGAAKMEITNISKEAVSPFVDAVHQQIESHKASSTQAGYANSSAADELIKLKSLMDSGALSKEEFEAEKQKILSR